MGSGKIIITGGAGYIGKITSQVLHQQGWSPVILDDYSTSTPWERCPFPLHQVSLLDEDGIKDIFASEGPITGIVHFAAKALVPESCAHPNSYFRNNVVGALNLIEAAHEAGVHQLIHSSTCAVYGVPQTLPITEQSPIAPISPYGESKRMVEEMLRQFHEHWGFSVLNLRYFNPAGALPPFGEAHNPETHLIPSILRAAKEGGSISVFGDDYQTSDGTCERDYIHVVDLAEAHGKALDFLQKQPSPLFDCINLGAGAPHSVLEVIKITEQITGKPITPTIKPRRAGDPPRLFADISKAKQVLGWQPSRSLEQAISSHWKWMTGK